MEYNTQQRKLPLPEYGRSVQHMVDHALTIEDREECKVCTHDSEYYGRDVSCAERFG